MEAVGIAEDGRINPQNWNYLTPISGFFPTLFESETERWIRF
jgi:hypothetical protein